MDDFVGTYRAMNDTQLARVAAEGGLLPDAKLALIEELRRRGITADDINYARDAIASYMQEVGADRPRWGSYFISPWGIGTAFRGRMYASEWDRANGVQLRTKWFIFLWIPVVPLGSSRIRHVSHSSSIFRSSSMYDQISKEALNWKQIRRTWGITAIVFVASCAFSYFF